MTGAPAIRSIAKECVHDHAIRSGFEQSGELFCRMWKRGADGYLNLHAGGTRSSHRCDTAFDTWTRGRQGTSHRVIIVYDAIIDDERKTNAFGLLMSLNMMIELEGGFDYTGADCIGWMRDAGFRDPYVKHLAGPDSMVVGIK